MDPFVSGYESYLEGCDIYDNPFDESDEAYVEWDNGWRTAEEDLTFEEDSLVYEMLGDESY